MEEAPEIKCRCGGTLKKVQTSVESFGIDFGLYSGEMCTKCGEVFLDHEVMREVEIEVKRRGCLGGGSRRR